MVALTGGHLLIVYILINVEAFEDVVTILIEIGIVRVLRSV